MAEFSFLIPARNEEFCARTVEDVLAHARGDFEIIVVLDGAWADPPIKDSQHVRLIYKPEPIGQRAATNLAARLATGTYICKLDAHCAIDDEFDIKTAHVIRERGRETAVVPAMCNLHAFNWSCGACHNETYQGPTPTICVKCQAPGPFKRVMYWDLNAGGVPGRKMRTEAWRFDHEMHFQYHGPVRPGQADAPIADVMSSVGACFVMRRDRFIELGGLDEAHGSWGQFGVEIALKSWLSGGTHVVARSTWFAHLFRTQGGDFAFPYPMRGSDQERARKHSRHLWLGNNWPGQTRPLSWLIEHFAPIRGWHKPSERKEDDALRVARTKRLAEVMAAGSIFAAKQSIQPKETNAIHKEQIDQGEPRPIEAVGTVDIREAESRPDLDVVDQDRTVVSLRQPHRGVTKGLLYYSDCRGDARILKVVRDQILRVASGLPIVSVTLKPLDFGRNIVLPLPRGPATMFKQILAGLEALDTEIVFFTEHDVLYHTSHFTFTPSRDDVFYFNQNTWRVDATTGRALFYYCNQVSGLCANRLLLLEHYRKRVAYVDVHGFDRNIGFEPGSNRRVRALIDRTSAKSWMSDEPNIDIKTQWCMTPGRWSQDQFRNKNSCRGWTESDRVPGWGITLGAFSKFLSALE